MKQVQIIFANWKSTTLNLLIEKLAPPLNKTIPGTLISGNWFFDTLHAPSNLRSTTGNNTSKRIHGILWQ